MNSAMKRNKNTEKIMNTNFIKKRTSSLIAGGLFALTLMSAPMHVLAAYSGPSSGGGGFSGPGPAVMTVKQASKQADDTWVTLRGKIISQHSDDMYTFQDASGQMLVEIDDDAWGGQKISAQNTVELLVKIDKDWNKTELEVETVRFIK